MSLWRQLGEGVVGIGYGIASFVAGYLITFILKGPNADSPFAGIDTGVVDVTASSAAHLVAWLYYAAHNVKLFIGTGTIYGAAERTVSLQQGPIWDGYLLVIPPIVLLAGSYLFASRQRHSTVIDFKAAFWMGIGYVGIALAGAYLSMKSISAGFAAVVVLPSLSDVLVFGGAYAVIFSFVGAHVAGWNRTAVESDESTGRTVEGR